MRYRVLPLLFLAGLLGALAPQPVGPAPAGADEPEALFGGFQRAPAPGEADGPDADLFRRAVQLQERGKYQAARRLFWQLIEGHPTSPFAPEAEDRSGSNAFLGYSLMHEPRPSERRIDVALMGDGYLFDRQDRFNKDATGHLKVFLSEPVFEAYEPYFNFWRFNLASKDSGVDEVEPRLPDEELEEHLKRRRRKRKVRTFETALDCKAAGPQGQVMANARCVWHYLDYLRANDGLALCFAKKGRLGMGGGGIATTAPRGVVVHEFGHAFTGLLDEYAIYAEKPSGQVRAANTTGDPEYLPWQHFIDVRYPGVGVYEGGATFKKGVWRPAVSCAMNTGGSEFCPVCREATVLKIYEYVSPIDVVRPRTRVVRRGPEGWPTIEVEPMRPTTHELEVTWYLGPEPVVTETEGESVPLTPEEAFGEEMLTEADRKMWERIRKRRAAEAAAAEAERAEGDAPPASAAEGEMPEIVPARAGRRTYGTAHEERPSGDTLRDRRRKARGGVRVHAPVLPALAPGRYGLTVVVQDPVRPRGSRSAWVVKDERGLLEDRYTWVLVVGE